MEFQGSPPSPNSILKGVGIWMKHYITFKSVPSHRSDLTRTPLLTLLLSLSEFGGVMQDLYHCLPTNVWP